jgi:DNA primase
LADDRVKRVKEANDIVEVVGGYVALRPAGPTYKGLCPFHDDHRPSFDVDPRRSRYRCWSCGKYGDVITFVQEYERVGFIEALELLERRAGIIPEKTAASPHGQGRALMLDAVRWAARQYHECLLDSPLAEQARIYLGQRGLKGETVRRYTLGYAPRTGDWLVQKAQEAAVSLDVLEKVGLIARRTAGPGFYDRFRDRVQFPVRDVNGRPVGFGGRILPGSPLESRAPKYYNSSDTPLFNKSELLYGLDAARQAAGQLGYLAVVEGYTDVLMAHQLGVLPVVATMGTALNARHVARLRQFAPRVVLVFDADAGGLTGVDRALAIFASHDVDLAIATLPEGLDPCDLLVQEGADAFRKVLDGAVDALEFKLAQVLRDSAAQGVEGQRRAVDAVLGVIALAPGMPGQAGAVKTQLMVTRIAQRLLLKEETVWARLNELRKQRRDDATGPRPRPPETDPEGEAPRAGKAAPEEVQLLEVLLAEPALVAESRGALPADWIQHPGLQRLVAALYALHESGETPTLDALRLKLDDDPILKTALALQDRGLCNRDRPGTFRKLRQQFEERRQESRKQQLHTQLRATRDPAAALDLLRRLQSGDGLVEGQG